MNDVPGASDLSSDGGDRPARHQEQDDLRSDDRAVRNREPTRQARQLGPLRVRELDMDARLVGATTAARRARTRGLASGSHFGLIRSRGAWTGLSENAGSQSRKRILVRSERHQCRCERREARAPAALAGLVRRIADRWSDHRRRDKRVRAVRRGSRATRSIRLTRKLPSSGRDNDRRGVLSAEKPPCLPMERIDEEGFRATLV